MTGRKQDEGLDWNGWEGEESEDNEDRRVGGGAVIDMPWWHVNVLIN